MKVKEFVENYWGYKNRSVENTLRLVADTHVLMAGYNDAAKDHTTEKARNVLLDCYALLSALLEAAEEDVDLTRYKSRTEGIWSD